MSQSGDSRVRVPFRVLSGIVALFALGSAALSLSMALDGYLKAVASGIFALLCGIDFGWIACRGHGLLVWGRKNSSRASGTTETIESTNGDASS